MSVTVGCRAKTTIAAAAVIISLRSNRSTIDGSSAMEDEKLDTDRTWTDLVVALAAAWSRPETDTEKRPADYGERLMAATRAVSRGRSS
jgi:hypothetical protein